MNKEKIELMKRLLDLYQQMENIPSGTSEMIVESYINKLEYELMDLIYMSLLTETCDEFTRRDALIKEDDRL